MLTAASFRIPKGGNTSNITLTGEWIKYSILNIHLTYVKNEVPTHAIAWMDLENIMLTERSHKRAHIYNLISLKSPTWANL